MDVANLRHLTDSYWEAGIFLAMLRKMISVDAGQFDKLMLTAKLSAAPVERTGR